MGTTVTQIAGGGRHSLALVPSGNKLYAFGYSIQGQLGRQTYKTSDIPQVLFNINSPSKNRLIRFTVKL